MANVVFANNASALLAASISAVDTSIQVQAGLGSLFPSPTGGDYFQATLENDNGDIEIVRCTSRTGDILTVVRAQEGTTAQAFTLTVTRVELRLTRDTLTALLQKSGGVLTGDLDLNGFKVIDAVLSGSSTQMVAGEIVGVPVRGAAGQTNNELSVPPSGRATVGGANILASGDDIVAELDTGGTIILDSATVGVRIVSGAYLRVEGPSSSEYFELEHDGTDVNINCPNTTDMNVTGVKVVFNEGFSSLGTAAFNGNTLDDAVFKDFAVQELDLASVSASVSLDYRTASYFSLTLIGDVTSFAITNPPPQGTVGSVRLRLIHSGAGRSVTWPGNYLWPEGIPPNLSSSGGSTDFVDLWTDNGGATWYGTSGRNWS